MTNIQCIRLESIRRKDVDSELSARGRGCRIICLLIPAGRQCRRMPTRSCFGTAAADEAIRGVLRIVSELLTSVGRPTKGKDQEMGKGMKRKRGARRSGK